MIKVMLARLLVLCCCVSLQACTSTRLIYPAKIESSGSSWVQKIKVGDKLEVLLKGKKVPVTLKVTEITSTEIKGEKNVSVAIDEVASVKSKYFSWVKITFLTLGIFVIAVIISLNSWEPLKSTESTQKGFI